MEEKQEASSFESTGGGGAREGGVVDVAPTLPSPCCSGPRAMILLWSCGLRSSLQRQQGKVQSFAVEVSDSDWLHKWERTGL